MSDIGQVDVRKGVAPAFARHHHNGVDPALALQDGAALPLGFLTDAVKQVRFG
nr:hypothetical protein SHINE37_42960 [Rhizobiaceae bacterium]